MPKQREMITTAVSPEVYAALRAQADVESRSMSAVVKRIVSAYVAELHAAGVVLAANAPASADTETREAIPA